MMIMIVLIMIIMIMIIIIIIISIAIVTYDICDRLRQIRRDSNGQMKAARRARLDYPN